MAKVRTRWHAPIGDRCTKDQATPAERDHNHLQAGLRALVEQAIGHLANALVDNTVSRSVPRRR